MENKYMIFEDIPKDSMNKRVIAVNSLKTAYREWLKNPTKRTVVKIIDLEVIEKRPIT